MFYPGTLVCPRNVVWVMFTFISDISYFWNVFFLHVSSNSGCFPPLFFSGSVPYVLHTSLLSQANAWPLCCLVPLDFFILRSSGHTVFSCNTPVPTKCLNFGLSAHAISAYLLHDLSTQSEVLLCAKSIPDQLHLLSPNYMIVPLLEQLVITGEGCDGFFGIFWWSLYPLKNVYGNFVYHAL